MNTTTEPLSPEQARAQALAIVDGITRADLLKLRTTTRKTVSHRVDLILRGEGANFSCPYFCLFVAETCRDIVTIGIRNAQKGAVN